MYKRQVGNRGSATSDMTYLRFQYEKVNSKGETELYPVDLTGHKLSVSDESPISRFCARDERTLSNGYLLLRTMQDGVETADATQAGQIQSMYGRTAVSYTHLRSPSRPWTTTCTSAQR